MGLGPIDRNVHAFGDLFRDGSYGHTGYTGSSCSNIGAADLVQFYSASGFSGVYITDHLDYFLEGWASVPKDAPWAERVGQFRNTATLFVRTAT